MNIDDLHFVRLTQANQFCLIPPELFEQLKESDYSAERLHQFGPIALTSPLTFLYVLADNKTSIVKGLLWAEVNPLSESLAIHILSVDKEYQGGDTVQTVIDFCRKILEANDLKKIEMITVRPKVYEEKHNFKRSNKIIMELI